MKNKHSTDAFSTFNPILNFTFFIGAIVLTMFFNHPVFTLCGVIAASAYLISIKGTAALKTMSGLLILFIAVSVINPLFSTGGNTVLFTIFGRPYTWEALCYGMSTGALLYTVMLWFSAYNAVMTSDKFIYIFGRLIPALSLVFTMVLRLVPNYIKKTKQIAGARQCIGRSGAGAERKEKINNGMTILSVMTTWALEGGVMTADSMRSRGYGCGRRTSFSVYRFNFKDILLLGLMIVLLGGVIFAGVNGAMAAAYIPSINIAPIDTVTGIFGLISYCIFMTIPTMINIKEAIVWKVCVNRV